MKSSMKFLMGSLILFSTLFAACSKESVNVQEASTEITEESLYDLTAQLSNTEREYTIEHATLDEVNKAMIENGLEPFSETDVEQARATQQRVLVDCNTWIGFGDWNQDGRLNISDIVLAQQYICREVGCSNTVDTSTLPFDAPRFFGYISFLFDSNGTLELNATDINIASDFILGTIPCK
ncbi:MAG: hypothetical protein AAF990_22915 [Bacteroidota bacterium]